MHLSRTSRRHVLAASIATLVAGGSFVAPPAHAWDWDPLLSNGVTLGGTGTWIDSAAPPAWYNGTTDVNWAPGNTAIFGGTAGIVTVSGTITGVNALTFNTTGYSLTGGGITLAANPVTLGSAVSASISSALAGTTGLSLTGNGTLTLTSATNTLTGAYNVGLGSTLIAVGDTLSTTGNDLVVNGTFDLTSTATINSGRYINNLTGSGTITSASSAGGGVQTSLRVKAGDFSGNIVDGGAGKPTAVVFQATGGLLNFSGNNTYTGDTLIREGGTLRLSSAGALPANSYLRFEPGAGITATLELNSGDLVRNLGTTALTGVVNFGAGTDYLAALGADRTVNLGATQVVWGTTVGFNPTILGFGSANATNKLTFSSPLSFNNVARTIDVRNGAAAIEGEFTGTITSGGTTGVLTKTGTGTLQFTGTNTITSMLIKAGTVILQGGSNTGAVFDSVGVNTGDDATLILNGNASYNAGAVDFNLGDVANARGRVDMNSTGTITVGTLYVGKGVNGVGVLNMNSGTLVNNAGGEWRIGGNTAASNQGYGVVNLSGGTITSGNAFQIGASNAGVMNQTGGTFNGGSWVSLARFLVTGATSFGQLNLSGGSFNQNSASAQTLILAEQGTGVINISGTGSLVSVSTLGVRMTNQASSNGTINLLGGSITAKGFAENGGGTSYIYLNGGTMKAGAASATYMQGLDNVVVGPTGATLDTNTFDITIAQALNAPSGNGIVTIPITSGGTGYAGQPIVQITGGGGAGATATANVVGGVVTSITITNPGINFSSIPTITLLGGGATTAAVLGAPTFGATATTGGLSKVGTGALTLTGANSYGGPTTITDGTLAVSTVANGGLNSGLGTSSNVATNLIFNGGALRFTGATGATDRNFTINAGKTATFEVNSGGVLTISGGSTATNGNITKIGLGVLNFTGANLHTGTTTVSAGVLGVVGTQQGPFSIAGGQLNAGYQTVGTATVPSLTLGSSGGADFDFGIGTNDVITIANVNGLTLGTSALNLYVAGSNTPFSANGTYTIFDYNTSFIGSLTGAFTIANSQLGKVYSIANNSGATTIDLTINDATSAVWNVDGGSSWNTGANWLPVGVPNSIGAFATFGNILTAGNAPANVTLDGAKTVGTILFDSANTYNITPGSGGTLTFNNGIAVPAVTVNAGSHSISVPMSLVSSTNLITAAGTTLTISGNVSGTGAGVTKSGAGTVVLSGSNSYTGPTILTAGTLEIAGATALGGTSSVIEKDAAILRINTGGAATLPAVTLDLGAGTATAISGLAGGNGNFTIDVATGTNASVAGVFNNPSGGSLVKRGPGTLTIANGGANVLSSGVANLSTVVQEGSLVFNGGAAATYAVTGGELTIGDNTPTKANVTLASGTLNVGTFLSVGRGNGTTNLQSSFNMTGGTLNTPNLYTGFANAVGGYSASPQINISGGTANASNNVRFSESVGAFTTVNLSGTGTLFSTGNIEVGYGGRAVLKIGAGSTANGNQFFAGVVANGAGAILNRGTLIDRSGASTNHFALGNATNAYGYYLHDTATATTLQEIGIGGAGGGSGVLEVRSGTLTAANWITINRTGVANATSAMLFVQGGTIVAPNIADRFYANNVATATLYSVIDVGAGGRIDGGANSNINLNNQALATHQTMLTIHNGGIVETPRIGAAQAAGTAIVNFNNGILRAEAAANILDANLDAVVIYPGGATIDTNGFVVANPNALVAPTGSGITTIPLSTPGTGYIGRPVVNITDPTGTGATAVANYDETTGELTGITITSPGSNYLAPTITLVGGGASIPATLNPATLGANTATGGFTKIGAGTLTLSAANTYGGPTSIEAGTLTITGSISGSSSINVKSGATLNVAGVAGGFSLAAGQTLKGDGTVTGNVTLAAGSSLSPGQSPGTLTFSNDLNISSVNSGALVFELGTTSDKVALNTPAVLTIGSNVIGFGDFTFSNAGGLTPGVYTLFDTATTIVGTLNGADLTGSFGAFSGTLSLANGNTDIVLTVVPEPTAALSLFGGLAALAGLRRRRRA